jgi:hypothetical protein
MTGHRAIIKLAGRVPNRDGLGSEIEIHTKSGVQVRQLFTERGIVSSELPQVHFGLGSDTMIEKITVRWPRGQVQTLENVPADQLITISEPAVPEGFKPPPARLNIAPQADAMFTESAAACGLKHSNTVRPFDEFTRERLLPRRLNGQGPALAVADVNGDGIEDVFVSGTAGQPGQLFLGRKDGTFEAAASQPWSTASEADGAGAVFVDVNGDGHPDLLVCLGGVQQERGDASLNDQLYLNDGHGNFTPAPAGTLPADGESTGAVAVADFDGDHRSDVFIGGRVVPGHYPDTPRSFLYHNVDGRLVDVTDSLAPGLRNVGLVTAATWADVDHDGHPDLLVATEWGPIHYFHNNGHGFDDQTQAAGLAGITGWWCSLAAVDVDGDGRIDLVAGNVGLNTKYHATAAEPTIMYAGDFDGRGREALIEAQYQDGKLYPARGRSKLAYTFPWLPKKYPTYQAYAQATVQDIFGADHLNAVHKFAATELASGVFRQQRDHTFKFEPLPRIAQIAPINTIIARDFDGDGKTDLYCVGNNFGPEPSTGRFDGSLGVLLKGDGHGGFEPILPADSGLSVTGEAHAAAAIDLPGSKRPAIIVARTEGPLLLFTPAKP